MLNVARSAMFRAKIALEMQDQSAKSSWWYPLTTTPRNLTQSKMYLIAANISYCRLS